MFKNYSFLPYSIFKEFEMNERPSPSDPMTMGHPCGSMSPIFRSDQGFHSFSLFLHSSPPDRGTEKSGQPSVIRNPNMDMVVCYRKERTHTHRSRRRHFHIERRPARKSSPRVMALSCKAGATVYRNLVEFQKLRHLTTPFASPFRIIYTH